MPTDLRGGGKAQRLVVLLRGINVGRGNRIAMADLRRLLTDLGYVGAQTHLQSGNVIVDSSEPPPAVAHRIAAGIVERFGIDLAVLTRSGAELADVVRANPLGATATDASRYVVAFLEHPPEAGIARHLEGVDFAPEQFTVRGREVYLWCPAGQHESPMVRALAKAGLTAAATARNWRTVQRLAELAAAE